MSIYKLLLRKLKHSMLKIYPFDSLQTESLASPRTLKQEMPALPHHYEFVKESRRQIANILEGSDNRLLLIVGPCSIHDVNSAKEYAEKLKKLSDDVSESFYIIMRTYFEKPRTALGWKGLLYDPHLDGSHDISTGIRYSRQLLLDLAELNIPTATEFLDPLAARYISDLLSWACIGARTTESQIHRQFASGLAMPIAFKNSTSGNINVAVQGVLTASCPHVFFGVNDNGQTSIIKTKGNPLTHIVLRGGEANPNYDCNSINKALQLLRKNQQQERLIVDCSHDNSNRCHYKQKDVFESVMQQSIDGNTAIRGLSLESNLFSGSQQVPMDRSRLRYAVSITDPCLDWEETEALIRKYASLAENKLHTTLTATTDIWAK